MKLFEIMTSGIKIVDKEPTDGLWFQHESPYKLSTLKALSYDELSDIRDKKYPIINRKESEDKYRELTHTPNNKSFLYATPVKYNLFGKPSDYPGYTYYFKLSKKQAEQVVFDIVDKKKWMQPTLGKKGLLKAIKIFKEHESDFQKYEDPNVGTIYPRIEVVIPFDIVPTLVYPQEEDR